MTRGGQAAGVVGGVDHRRVIGGVIVIVLGQTGGVLMPMVETAGLVGTMGAPVVVVILAAVAGFVWVLSRHGVRLQHASRRARCHTINRGTELRYAPANVVVSPAQRTLCARQSLQTQAEGQQAENKTPQWRVGRGRAQHEGREAFLS